MTIYLEQLQRMKASDLPFRCESDGHKFHYFRHDQLVLPLVYGEKTAQ